MSEKHNYNLDLFYSWGSRFENKFEFDGQKVYEQGDTVFFKNTAWVASLPMAEAMEPQSIFLDENDDGARNNPWRPIYPWSILENQDGQKLGNGEIELIVKSRRLASSSQLSQNATLACRP